MTREAIELGIILNQIPKYHFSMDDFSDRLKLQKTIYLLQAFGVNLGYNFSWYLRGPYCTTLAANGFTLVKVYEDIPDKVFKFKSKRAQEEFSNFLKFVKGMSVDDLEIAASIHYLKKGLEYDDSETIKKIGSVASSCKQVFNS